MGSGVIPAAAAAATAAAIALARFLSALELRCGILLQQYRRGRPTPATDGCEVRPVCL